MRARRLILLLMFGVMVSLVWPGQGRTGMAEPRSETPPLPPSPVALFRELLELDEAGRARRLASWVEPRRGAIEAKLAEYDALPPMERELRLEATELRWHLRPLLDMNPDQRTGRLAVVPGSLRPVVERRLASWDRLTPEVQREVVESDWALEYFLRHEAAAIPTMQGSIAQRPSLERRRLLEREFARWQSLPLHRRQRMTEHFEEFFELSLVEQAKTLDVLPESERRQIEATLQAFARLPAAERRASLEAFHRFAALTSAERAEFLRNAGRWKEMSAADQAIWRRLVPQLPPSPPGLFEPPLPPGQAVRRAPGLDADAGGDEVR